MARHKHDWNDAVVFYGEAMQHAQAVCDICGLIAFERGYTPKKPVYCQDRSGEQE